MSPGALSQFVIVTDTEGTTANDSSAFTVTAKDAQGNVKYDYASTATLSSNDANISWVSPASTSLNFTASSGVKTVSLRFKTAGSRTFTVTQGVSATSTAINVVPAAKSKLVIVTQPGGGTAGATWATQPVVEIRDAYDNKTSDTDSVTLALTTGTGALSGTASVNAIAGTATFSGLSINLTGTNKVLTASSGALTTAASSAFTISPDALNNFLVQISNATPTAGASVNVTVTARDQFNNTKTNFTGNVWLTSTDGSMQLTSPASSPYSYTGGDAGVKVWALNLRTAGAQTIYAANNATYGSATATGSVAATVSAASAHELIFVAGSTAGSPETLHAGTCSVDGS